MSNVQVLIDAAKAHVDDLVADATTAMEAASEAASDIPFTVMSYNPPAMPAYVAPSAVEAYTGTTSVTFDPGTAPSITSGVAIPGVDTQGAPTFSATAPTYTQPTAPTPITDFTGTAPVINTSITFPTAPTLVIPDAPTLATRTAPTAPTTTLPTFGVVAPTDTSVAPTGLENTMERAFATASPTFVTAVTGYVDAMMASKFPNYQSQMSAIKAQLDKYFAGGTALSADVEQAIYHREQDRNDLEARRVESAVYNESAGRGFTMPTGAINSQIQRARQDAANLNAKKSNEIAIAQAEMEQKNLQFAVSTTASLLKNATDTYIAYMQNLGVLNGQAMDYAKSIVGAIVESYNIQVKAFAAKIDAYRAQAAVYETNLRASLAGVELYKAQIDALQAMTNVDRATVDVYRARLDTLTAAANVYRVQVDAVQSQASLEKLKLEMFQTQVQTYSAQVNAKNAQWQGYSAQIEGELSKVKMYAGQVDAYNGQVQAYRAKIEAQSTAVNAAAATNRAIAEQNSALLDAYKTVVSAKGEVARTQVSVGQLQVQAYEASTHAAVANAQTAAEYYKAIATTNIEQGRLGVQTMIESAKVELQRSDTVAKVATANAQIFANLAGSAMAGMNTLAAEQAIL